MKKTFGLLVASEEPEINFFAQRSLYEKISKTFDEFFIINLINFNLFKKKMHKNKYLKNILPHNFKVIIPENKYELNKFLVDKSLVAFDGLGKGLRHFRLRLLIKKYNIRLIFLSNIGYGNHYLGRRVFKKKGEISLKNNFFILNKIIIYCLIKVMILLNLFSRIDIYFESNKTIVNNCNNSLAKKIEKIFPFLKICYFKKIIHINPRAFDTSTKLKLNLSEDKIVFIDSDFDNGDRIIRDGRPTEELRLKYFTQLSQFLLELSNIFNKKIAICLHPKASLETYKKYLGEFELCKFKTTENIKQAFIVVFHTSTVIHEAIFLKKKIISLKSNTLGEHMANMINYHQKLYGLFSYSLDEKKELNKNLLQAELEKITENYNHYIKGMMNENSTLGEDKVIDTIKKEYIINNVRF